jgi:hypothetical protein
MTHVPRKVGTRRAIELFPHILLFEKSRCRAGTPWETHAREYADKRVDDQEKGRMVAVARELPDTGYALEVDGRLKTEFETKEGACTGAEELKRRFPMLRVKIYDAETKTTEEFQLPSS